MNNHDLNDHDTQVSPDLQGGDTDSTTRPVDSERLAPNTASTDAAESHPANRAEGVPGLARHRDPSQTSTTIPPKTAGGKSADPRGRGVVWVRPTDLLAQASSRLVGRGIDFQAELARRTRRAPVRAVTAGGRAVGVQVRRLPPVSAFGRGHAPVGAVRSGIGFTVR